MPQTVARQTDPLPLRDGVQAALLQRQRIQPLFGVAASVGGGLPGIVNAGGLPQTGAAHIVLRLLQPRQTARVHPPAAARAEAQHVQIKHGAHRTEHAAHCADKAPCAARERAALHLGRHHAVDKALQQRAVTVDVRRQFFQFH